MPRGGEEASHADYAVHLRVRHHRRPNFVQQADSLAGAFTLVSGEGLVAIGPSFLEDYPAGGVSVVRLSDPGATWDFLVVWQRGRTSAAMKSLLAGFAALCEGKLKKGNAEPAADQRR